MKQLYKRVENIDDKVKNASLPYLQWKMLFLIGEHSDATEISSLLGEDVSKIKDILASLESAGYIEIVSAVQEEPEAVEKTPKPIETSLGDELLEQEDLISNEEEGIVEEPEETLKTEMASAKDDADSSIGEEPEMADEKNSIIDVNTDFLNENMIPVDEAAQVKKQEPKSEDVLADESETDIEDFDLDLDIGEESEIKEQVQETMPVEKPAVEERAAEEETISDVSKKTIMVIDDSIVIRKMIEIALEDEDFNIVTAISGKEGLEIVEARQPNLVILDMMLPDMNGIEVLKAIKGSTKIPVIMLSGKDSPQLIENAKEIGVDDFLPKPFRDEDLVEKVKTLVGA